MKKIFILLACLALLSAVSTTSYAVMSNLPGGTDLPQVTNPETTITVTIVKIDLSTKTVVLKDQNGKIYTFVLGPDSTIDLSKYKVGDKVTASLTTITITDKVTRARISKTQLIKLQ